MSISDAEGFQAASAISYRVVGMDCAHDAAQIEAAVDVVPGVIAARVSVASHLLTLDVRNAPAVRPAVEDVVAALGYQLQRYDEHAGSDPAAVHSRPEFRRALWIVVMLNVGFGLVEMVGGFLSGSQALKADALDFVGDGLITWLGIIAIGWHLAWRARAALIQGIFLGALGVGVLANTIYRIIAQQQPAAEVMGLLGVAALAVNVAAAAVLLPHRGGDANVRAVWLFSRNDAIGNAAVIISAGLVALTTSPWPDLVVAALMAGLFLHSAFVIVRDARADLAAISTTG